MYGPGTNLASGGSLIFHSECQIRHIMGMYRSVAGIREIGDRAASPTATTTGTPVHRPS